MSAALHASYLGLGSGLPYVQAVQSGYQGRSIQCQGILEKIDMLHAAAQLRGGPE